MDFLDEFMQTLKAMAHPDLKNRSIVILKSNNIFNKIAEFFIYSKEDINKIMQVLNIIQNILLI